MTKRLAILPALALVVALSGSAVAENGAVSEATLKAMGLSGIQVMSDDAAMAVRGMGYTPMTLPPMGGSKRWSLAYGTSYANIGKVNVGEESIGGLGAGTIDGFAAEGKFMASGEHFSEAGKIRTKSVELKVKGLPGTLRTTTWSVRVYAGGSASASSL